MSNSEKIHGVNPLRLKLARTSSNIPIQEICEKVGLDEDTLRAYEKGTKLPEYNTVEALANIYNRQVLHFFFKDEALPCSVEKSLKETPTSVLCSFFNMRKCVDKYNDYDENYIMLFSELKERYLEKQEFNIYKYIKADNSCNIKIVMLVLELIVKDTKKFKTIPNEYLPDFVSLLSASLKVMDKKISETNEGSIDWDFSNLTEIVDILNTRINGLHPETVRQINYISSLLKTINTPISKELIVSAPKVEQRKIIRSKLTVSQIEECMANIETVGDRKQQLDFIEWAIKKRGYSIIYKMSQKNRFRYQLETEDYDGLLRQFVIAAHDANYMSTFSDLKTVLNKDTFKEVISELKRLYLLLPGTTQEGAERLLLSYFVNSRSHISLILQRDMTAEDLEMEEICNAAERDYLKNTFYPLIDLYDQFKGKTLAEHLFDITIPSDSTIIKCNYICRNDQNDTSSQKIKEGTISMALASRAQGSSYILGGSNVVSKGQIRLTGIELLKTIKSLIIRRENHKTKEDYNNLVSGVKVTYDCLKHTYSKEKKYFHDQSSSSRILDDIINAQGVFDDAVVEQVLENQTVFENIINERLPHSCVLVLQAFQHLDFKKDEDLSKLKSCARILSDNKLYRISKEEAGEFWTAALDEEKIKNNKAENPSATSYVMAKLKIERPEIYTFIKTFNYFGGGLEGAINEYLKAY